MRPRRLTGGFLTVAVLAAGLLTLTGHRVAVSAETRLTALSAEDHVPADEPFDSYWENIPPVEMPLSAQNVTPPHGGRQSTVWARAIHDDENLYVLLEWSDTSASASASRVQDFTDAAAVQFPADGSESVPPLCMGDPTRSVNIWQWRASWQEHPDPSILEEYPNTVVDDYPFSDDPVFAPGRALENPVAPGVHGTSVDNLVAGGFGSLTSDEVSPVQGVGEWRGDRWRVVFSRPLEVGREGNVELPVGTKTNLAFAVWDGAAGERNGMKSVSGFATLSVSPEPADFPADLPAWTLLVGVVLMVLIAVWYVWRQPMGVSGK